MLLTKQLRMFFYTLIAVGVGIVVYFFSPNNPQLQNVIFIAFSILLIGQALVKTTGVLDVITKIIKSQKNKENAKNSSILVVDDNIGNRKVIVEILSTLSLTTSLRTVEANNGKQAVNLFKNHKFKLIFMDIEMRGMNGLEATKAIRLFENKQQRTPIIAVSAHTTPEKMHRALIAGCDDYLSKPIDDKKLTDTLNRWLHIGDTSIKEASTTRPSIPHPMTEGHRDTIVNENINKVVDIKIVDTQQALVYSYNNPELAKDMLRMLINQIVEERDSIIKLFENANWEDLGHHVHKIRGSGCHCGVAGLQKYAEAIDEAIDQQKIDKVKSNFPNLLNAMDELIDWNKQYDIETIFS